METMTLLIADSSPEFRNTLTAALQSTFRIHSCATGKEALEVLLREKPDLVVMDLMLPELDGLTLLQTLRESGIQTTVLATTRLVNEYVITATAKLGVDYIMYKPCDIRAIVGRIRDISAQKPKAKVAAPDDRTYVSNILVSLGINTKLRGYNYLREAVLIMRANPMQSITKELYPKVAREFLCTPTQVERSIRNAVQKAWENRDEDLWLQYFRENDGKSLSRPSNATFISRLADRLLLDQMRLTMPD